MIFLKAEIPIRCLLFIVLSYPFNFLYIFLTVLHHLMKCETSIFSIFIIIILNLIIFSFRSSFPTMLLKLFYNFLEVLIPLLNNYNNHNLDSILKYI
jgi:hypothetical protein